MRDVLVELFVFFSGHVSLAAGPQGLRLVDFFPGDGAVFFVFAFNLNRQCNVVGVFADHGTQTPGIEILIFAFAQMQGNFGTAIFFADIGNGVIAFADRFPEHALIGRSARGTSAHGDFIRHDERGVEAHAELADQLAVFGLIGADRLQEGFSP
ncbi:hypothetical protein D3C72_1790540 [compost metagenome]